MSKQYKLLPCPFCGGEGEMDRQCAAFKEGVAVHCKVCNCATAPIYENVKYCAVEEAAKAWNRRVDTLTLPAVSK